MGENFIDCGININIGELSHQTNTGQITYSTTNSALYYTNSAGNNIMFTEYSTDPAITTEHVVTNDRIYNYNTYTTHTNNIVWTELGENYEQFHLFNNDIIKITDTGEVYINDKKELNPSKIGLALLRAINNIKDNADKIDSIDEL